MRTIVIPSVSHSVMYVIRCSKHLIFSVIFLIIEMHFHKPLCLAPFTWYMAASLCLDLSMSCQHPNADKLINAQG